MLDGMTSHPDSSRQGIVPPYLLRRLAESDGPLAGPAKFTLTCDARHRVHRAAAAATVHALLPGRTSAATEGPSREIFDAGNSERLPGRSVRTEGGSATGDAAVDEAYDGFGATWRLYSEEYGRNSIDDAGMRLLGTVHYGEGYQNAFWNGSRMVFGDGDGQIFGRFTASLDVIGHELTHGVIEHSVGLVYSGQSGALNESVADVFGALVAQFTAGQTADQASWLIGEELLLPEVKGTALRSMLHPGTAYDDPRLGKDPQPDRMSRFVDTPDDYGGVHINSGIPNRAFYTLAMELGGKAWEAPAQIWYDVMVGDIKADCDFSTFAHLTIEAAKVRFGAESPEVAAVQKAWETVEVKPAPAKQAPRRKPPKTTHVQVRRTGGFAGLTKERSVKLADLPPDDTKAWQALLVSRELHSMAATAPVMPDAFCYGINCQRPSVHVEIPEPSLRDEVRDLFERTLSDSDSD